MKIKIFKFVFFVFILFFFPTFVWAKSWNFENWVSEITINPDSTFVVRETYTINFEGPFTYFQRDLAMRKFKKVTDIKVYDESGRELGGSEVETKRGIGKVSIKINFQAQDEQKVWTLEYKIHGGIGFFSEYDELYWNVTGAEWEIPKNRLEAIVHLPSEVPASQLRQRLFIGPQGSREEADTYAVVDGQTLRYWGEEIKPYEDFTMVAGWPKGLVQKDWWLIMAPYFWFLLPLGVFVLLYWRWSKVGKDPKPKGTIIPQYEPPGKMTPGEMGALVSERFNVKYISSSLVDLAYRGYLKIEEKEKKGLLGTSSSYNFVRAKDFHSDPGLKEHERQILGGVFATGKSVSLETLKNKYYRHIPGIQKAVFAEIVQAGYYLKDPRNVSKKYVIPGFLILIFAAFVLFGWGGFFPGIALGIAGVLMIVFGRFMPARTQKGADALWHALGFKEYLHVAERFRLKANVDPKVFEKYLSYAMVFGVEKQWANRFADIYREPPDWYVPAHSWAAFNVVNFSSNISSMSTSFSSTFASSPSSSSGFGGGGSAGGGGGGGGGSAG